MLVVGKLTWQIGINANSRWELTLCGLATPASLRPSRDLDGT